MSINTQLKNDWAGVLPAQFIVFEEHCLVLSVRTNDEIVIGEQEFDDRMKAGEAPMTREHLFDEDARVTRANEMDESSTRVM